MQYKNDRRSRKILTLGLATLLIVLAIGCVLYRDRNSSTSTPDDDGTINYNPPTEEEKQAGDKQKDEIIQEEDVRNNPIGQNKQTASVIITDAGQYSNTIEVRAFIPDHYQDGTCVITFTKDNLRVSKETPAYRDVSTTICTNPNFDRSEFKTSGVWQLRVSYTAESAAGASEPTNITLQ